MVAVDQREVEVASVQARQNVLRPADGEPDGVQREATGAGVVRYPIHLYLERGDRGVVAALGGQNDGARAYPDLQGV